MKLDWLRNDLVAFSLIVLLALAVGFSPMLAPVQAASAPTNVCEAVATAGNITVYYCELDTGPSLYVNSVGFMAVSE